MTIDEALVGVAVRELAVGGEEVWGVEYDSRRVGVGDVFCGDAGGDFGWE